jgi:hypothetical protein
MSNRTYICTDCRTARRAPSTGGLQTGLRCRCCSGPLWELSHRWRIPKSTDQKAWKELCEMVAGQRPCRERYIRSCGEYRLREIDRQVTHFSVRRPSKKRDDALKDLENQRASVLRLYFGERNAALLHAQDAAP